MEVTLEEVQDYWARYCIRHALKQEIMTQGKRLIALDHSYWADHTMRQLHEKVGEYLKKKRDEARFAKLAD